MDGLIDLGAVDATKATKLREPLFIISTTFPIDGQGDRPAIINVLNEWTAKHEWKWIQFDILAV